MIRTLAFATAVAVALGGVSAPGLAGPCKDAKGKFTKCPPVTASTKCRKDGKFAKCGTPGAVPVKK